MSGDSGELKSALDIAMEKAQRMGSLSSDEVQNIKYEKLVATGESLAKRYLGGFPLRDIEIELKKRDEHAQVAITSYLVSNLANVLDIRHIDQLDKILYAIQHFIGDTDVSQRITDLFGEYAIAIQKARDEHGDRLGAIKMLELEKLGISGSAVQPAFESSLEWLDIQQELYEENQRRLNELTNTWKRFQS